MMNQCKRIFCCCCYSQYDDRFMMRTQIFGTLPFAQPIQLYEIENKHGMVLSVINYGARIIGLKVPSLRGDFVDVVCGLKTLEDYEKDPFYFGAIVGRCAGRVNPPVVTIDGKGHHLTENSGDVHLHGGLHGFDKAIWKVDPIEDKDGIEGLHLRHISPAGTEGYPGELITEVEYRLTNDNEVIIKIKATSQEATIVNLPQHAYFNFGGPEEPNVYEHVISINAESYLPMGRNSTPTGEVAPVEKSLFDFRKPRNLGEAIRTTAEDAYDHCWCLATTPNRSPKHAANVYHPKTGINMEILTTQPGLLMYTGNYLHAGVIGKYGEILDRHSAVCFETQNYPNAINVPAFPSPIVRPGMPYDHTTIWRFSKVKHKTSSDKREDKV